MAKNTLTTLDKVLKELYKGQQVEKLVYKDFPLLGIIPKMSDFRGRIMPFPISYAYGGGRSAVFANAQSQRSEDLFSQWEMKTVSNYAVATITGEAADIASGEGAFLDSLTTTINYRLEDLTRDLGRGLFRSSTGTIGAVGSVSTNSLVLSNPEDAALFEIGMTVEVSSTDGGEARSGSEVIKAVDRSAGTLTSTNANWTDGISAITNDDVIRVVGDRNAKVSGLADWLPASAPGSSAFFGVNRSVDPDRLGGVRYDGSGMPISEALQKGVASCMINGGSPDIIVLNPMDYQSLAVTLQGNATYELAARDAKGKVIGGIGFNALLLNTPVGGIKVISDAGCPVGVAYGLETKTWLLISAGRVPKLLDQDGLTILRMASADGYEVRCGFRANLVCKAPGRNVRIKLA